MPSVKRDSWVVVVRLADGRQLYYSPSSGRQGQEDWSPRESQAHRYPTQDAAQGDAEKFTTNDQAQEYTVLQVR